MSAGWCLARRSTEEDSARLAVKQRELKDLLDPIFSEGKESRNGWWHLGVKT